MMNVSHKSSLLSFLRKGGELRIGDWTIKVATASDVGIVLTASGAILALYEHNEFKLWDDFSNAGLDSAFRAIEMYTHD